ncbi:MAG: sulfotransferase [Candidatus Polarisedimenticolaceae bacterium]|nr:sulfotransferase [Candidatus Polarisedimenticolaceae bacterium]
MWNDKNIIFLISMPRSGSTLLQRILANHTDINTTSESWLLLPQLYALQEEGVFSEYSHITSSRAINDFCSCLSGEKKAYLDVIKRAIIDCYKSSTKSNARFYLEKTPRNNLILKDICSMFPDARYIFLWRNPAAIVASMINSFSDGKWNIYRHEIDLYKGFKNMLDADSFDIRHRHDIKYEDLATSPSVVTKELFRFLDLPTSSTDKPVLGDVSLLGRMGDKSGVQEYKQISALSLDKWKSSFPNTLRQRWLKSYLNDIGSENLSKIGYSKSELMRAISSIESGSKYLLSDFIRMTYGALDARYQISLIRRLRKQNKGKRKYVLQ